MYLTALPVAALFLSLTHGAALRPRGNFGDATFYGGNLQGGACMFSPYTLPSGVFGTALSDSNWDTAGNCGACVQVTGPGGDSITAMIVDECPGCGLNHLDLFMDSFKVLADVSKGIIPVTWEFVDCPITTPLELHNKDGVSRYWFSMQVVNAVKPVSSLEVSTDGGATWTQTTRTDYNFFEYSSGFGTDNVDVRVTSADGATLIVNNVAVTSGGSTAAANNFGPGSAPKPDTSSSAPVAAPTGTSSEPNKPIPSASSTSLSLPGPPQGSSSTTVAAPPIPTTTVSPTQAAQTPLSTGSAGQFYTSSSASTPIPALASTSSIATSTVTVYSYEGC